MKFFTRQTILLASASLALIGLQGCGSKDKKAAVEAAVEDLATEQADYDNFSVENLFRGSGGRYQICSVNGTDPEMPDSVQGLFKLRVERILGNGESEWKAVLHGFCGAAGHLEKELEANHTSKLQGEMDCKGVWGVFDITHDSGLDAVVAVCDEVLGPQSSTNSTAPANATESTPTSDPAALESYEGLEALQQYDTCHVKGKVISLKPLNPKMHLWRSAAALLALLGLTMLQGCSNKSDASTTGSPAENEPAAGTYTSSQSSSESFRHQKNWSVYHPGKTTHKQVCTARYNDTRSGLEYDLKLERRKDGNTPWTAKLSGNCGDKQNLEAELSGENLENLQGEKDCVAAWAVLGVTPRVIVARKHIPPVLVNLPQHRPLMDLHPFLNLLLAILAVFIGTVEIQGCSSKSGSSTRGGANGNSTESAAEEGVDAKQAYKQAAPDEVKDGGKFKICRAASTDGMYKLSVQRTLKTGDSQWKIKLVGEKCGDKTGLEKEIADDTAKALQGEDVPCKTVWSKFEVTADNPSRLKTLCTDAAWLGAASDDLEGCGSKEEIQSEQSGASNPDASPSASSSAASQSSSSSSSSRTSVRKKWSRMIPGTPGDTIQSCDASAGTYHLILKRLKRGGQNNYEVSMIGNKCGTETVAETPLNDENTAKLQEDGISCAQVWEALAITTAGSNEATLSAMCTKLKEGQL
ncbi:hypothetical protein FOL47_002832 [Perkinsus chesapeaki]|uniref:Uncharacterized protein n=1 Tax=Perkinsus chesapeaki TaxID=330153 RepID=A0A7J6MBG3_PERCH|nr:hypothetical protein FOL47_002832 [Perkinsus chesapeaki]